MPTKTTGAELKRFYKDDTAICPVVGVFVNCTNTAAGFGAHPIATAALYLSGVGIIVPSMIYAMSKRVFVRLQLWMLWVFGVSVLIAAVVGWVLLLSR